MQSWNFNAAALSDGARQYGDRYEAADIGVVGFYLQCLVFFGVAWVAVGRTFEAVVVGRVFADGYMYVSFLLDRAGRIWSSYRLRSRSAYMYRQTLRGFRLTPTKFVNTTCRYMYVYSRLLIIRFFFVARVLYYCPGNSSMFSSDSDTRR